LLTSTYIHIRGIRPAHERALWDQGALTWQHFLAEPQKWDLGGQAMAPIHRAVAASLRHYEAGEYQYFARRLNRKEHWRAFAEFREQLAYLDIETQGTRDDCVTVVGLYDGVEYRSFVRGENLADFPDAISHFSGIVTYFGTGFDLPMLLREFPNLEFDQFHIDLCPTLHRLGYRGGLKSVERQFGIERSARTSGLSGRDAVILWRRARSGDQAALDLLIEYNREDVVNLERLGEEAYLGLRQLAMDDWTA
jgi:uncharacterized protein YprB with RNaseH-like and TPR domain